METFRRFRSRRKSKGQADAFTSFADAESNYNRSTSSAWQTANTTATTRSSATASRPSDTEIKLSHDQLRQPSSPTSPTQRSPGQSSRIQPLLVGISRPNTTTSRPGTAVSIQTALDRAADSVHYPPRGTQSPISQVGLRSGRYIDIFAISGQSTKPATTFNEDIAERNLDTIALTIEEQHYTYEPSSKYQEEVAARNVLPLATQRLSSEQRTSRSRPTKEGQNSSMSPHSDLYARHAPSEAGSARSKRMQDVGAYLSRQNSFRPKDGPDSLPIIPQEQSSDDYDYTHFENKDRVQEAELEMERAKARWLGERRHNAAPANIDKPLPASPRLREDGNENNNPLRSHPVNKVAEIPEVQSMRILASTGTNQRSSGHPESQQFIRSKQDSLHNGAYRSDRRSAHTAVTNSSEESRVRSDISVGPNDRRSYTSDQSRRTQPRRPSTTSANSYRRAIVGNRFIMDLTAEDDAEDASVASYMQTPVLEDAREDALQKVTPTVVDHYSPPRETTHSDPVVPNSRWSSALEPVLDLDQLARRSQIISETAKAAAAARSQARAAENQRSTTPPPSLAFSPIQTMTGSPPSKTIAFSSINTLTSITPRSSHEILVTKERQLPSEQGPVKRVTSKDLLATIQKDGRTEKSSARISANIAPLFKVVADVNPEESRPTATVEKPPIARAGSASLNSSELSDVAKRNERRKEKLARAEAIREAAKKKIPAGPLDSEPMPGVKTRDFAMVPMEKPTNKRIEALSERKRSQPDLKKPPSSSSKSSSSDKKNRAKPTKGTGKVSFDESSVRNVVLQPDRKNSKKSSKSGSSTSRKARPISVFDEEAFQKKHAEANAALIRLQQSLQESLDEDSQLETLRDTNTPISRTFSPVGSVAHGKSPIPPSPSAAAIAMIRTVTSSPRLQTRPKAKTRMSSSSSQNTVKPVTLIDGGSEENSSSLQTTTLNRSNAAALVPLPTLTDANKQPPSPAISLSSFPIPTPRTMSPESNRSPPAYVKEVDGPVRRGSQASRVSTASAFAIPSTMVPNRLGSLPENRAGPPGPPNPHQMQSIDAIIPSAHPVSSL